MTYTKKNIFPLYVGKCKVNTPEGTGILQGISDWESVYPEMNFSCSVYLDKSTINRRLSRFRLPDCTLLLKPISTMNEENKEVYNNMVSQFVFFDTCETYEKEAVKLTLWLIQHGYAISDQLFELGIAERVEQ